MLGIVMHGHRRGLIARKTDGAPYSRGPFLSNVRQPECLSWRPNRNVSDDLSREALGLRGATILK